MKFVLGFIIGSFIGITLMCVLQVSREEDTYGRDIK